jgi:hypothetical protein
MKNEIPRKPGFYTPSLHAKQQRKHRGIDWRTVVKTITDGIVKNSHKENCCLFVQDFHYTDRPVGVVVNYVDGAILTIEFRQE